MTLTKEEFIKEYGFPKPDDKSDRDMIIKSNLSDIQHLLAFSDNDKSDIIDKIDSLKRFLSDTKDI